MADNSPDSGWLGDLSWKGYPRLEAIKDDGTPAVAKKAPRVTVVSSAEAPPMDPVAAENAALRARLKDLARLAADFERRLSEAGNAYEAAVLEAESRVRDSAMERERIAGERDAARAEGARLIERDAAREADLRVERERRADADKSLIEAKGRIEELSAELERYRSTAAEQAGVIGELRRESLAHSERLMKLRALTDQDVRNLRNEMNEFLERLREMRPPSADAPES